MAPFNNIPFSLLCRGYEKLREQALHFACSDSIKEPKGMALLMARGMTSWMRTYSQSLAVENNGGLPGVKTRDSSEVVLFPSQKELAELIANLILSHPLGATV